MFAKGTSDSFAPSDFRLLTVASAIYRRWAAVRLGHLSEWASTWALPEMCGIKGDYQLIQLHDSFP